MTRRTYGLAVLAIFLVGVALRTLPLYQSPLPFNPDGIHHASIAAEAASTGRLPLYRMPTDYLIFSPLLAMLGEVVGVDPLLVGQPVSAVVGTLPAVLAVAVVRRLARGLGWPTRRAYAAATLAGLLLAVQGLYLHRSMPTDAQTLGLFLVPLGAVATARAYRTDRRAWAVAAAVVLVVLPPLHNLDSVVMALALTLLVAVAIVRDSFRSAARLVIVAGCYWLYLAVYSFAAYLLAPTHLRETGRILAIGELLPAWLVLVAVAVAWLLGTGRRAQRGVGLAAFAILFGVVAVNAVTPVFPGTQSTPTVVLVGLAPLVVLAGLAAWATPAVIRERTTGLALVGLAGGPAVLVGVSLSGNLTPTFLNMGYRTQPFLHFSVVVVAAVGAVALATARFPQRRTVRLGVAALVVASAVTSAPLAFGGLAVTSWQGVTTPGELSASTFAATHANDSWASDDHLVRNARNLGLDSPGAVTPVYDWLRGGAPPPDCLVVGKRSWTTTGAQFFPAPPERLPEDAYEDWRRTRSVVYHGGSGDPIKMAAPSEGGTCSTDPLFDSGTRGP